jgi:hypothetical protein
MKGGARKNTKQGHYLAQKVRLDPTLTASSYGTRNNGNPGDERTEYRTKGSPSLETMALERGGWLNPTWCDAFMGFPIGWTDGPRDSETLPLFGSPNG